MSTPQDILEAVCPTATADDKNGAPRRAHVLRSATFGREEKWDAALIEHRREGLRLLLQGFEYAVQAGRSEWEFSVEIEFLHSAGLTNNDLRLLMCQGYLRHAREQLVAQAGRSVEPDESFRFTPRSCFALTQKGARYALQVAGSPVPFATMSQPLRDTVDTTRPVWDCDRRELRVGTDSVKRFKLPSPNQEMILTAFQEEGWPTRIDDPLPNVADLEPKRRLQDTIRSLNRNQKVRRIRFAGDGTGEGLLWELV